MTYCTLADYESRFGASELIQLTNRDDATQTTVNTAVLASVIADADAVIDSYLNEYLPLATVPANLVRLACNITRYYLYDLLAPDTVKEGFKEAIDFLLKVQQGKIALAPDSAGVVEVPNNAMVAFTSAVSAFGRDEV